MVGILFWGLPPYVVGGTVEAMFSAISWLCIISSFIQIFKAQFLVLSNARFCHEYANNLYSPVVYWAAEFTTTCICSLVFLPGVAVAYFMIDFPAKAAGFVMLVTYILGLVAEGNVHVLSLFTRDAAYAVVVAQGFMVIIATYTTGSFVRPFNVKPWWEWFEALSYFSPASHAIAGAVLNELTFSCANDVYAVYSPSTNTCEFLLYDVSFPCNVESADGMCRIRGDTVLRIYKGIDKNIWTAVGELVALGAGFRILTLIFLVFPPRMLWARAIACLQTHCSWRRNRATAEMNSAAKAPRSTAELVSPKAGDEEHSNGEPAAAEVAPAALTRAALCLEWRRLRVAVNSRFRKRNRKVLLESVSGSALGGRMLSLMGASGAGKTTMLNALSGRAPYATVTGGVLLNGQPLLRGDLNYVPQFDYLDAFATVEELLYYAARLKRRPSASREEIHAHVTTLLGILGLEPHRNKYPGALTSGQRKRTSIGIGLAPQPRVMFFDEPTTVRKGNEARNSA